MTRINTNVSALTANQNLTHSNNMLQTTLTRLSTGLRINSAADDPAGMIAATNLGSNIVATKQAIANSQVASQMISTADSALSQISSLLTTINGLVTQAANTSSESSSQIAANQLQIDSSLSAINSIAQTTTFQGQNLLDGSLAFQTTGGTNFSAVQDLQVNQVNFGTASVVPVDINVTALAKQAQIAATANDGASSDQTATDTLTFNDGSTLTVNAPTGSGASANGIQVNFQESGAIAVGTASAAFNSATNTLNITVSNSGTTTGETIASAINNDTTFTATAAQGAAASSTYGYAAGTDTRTEGSTTINTADGGSLVVSSLIPGATDTDKVKFAESASTPVSAPTVAFAAGVLTVTVNSNAKTSLASIASAINNYAQATGVKPFAATIANAGTFDTAASLTTGVAPDGVAAATASAGEVKIAGAQTGVIALDSAGALDNGAEVLVTKSTSGTSTAVWNATGDGGKGQLTLSLANGTYTAADMNTLLSNATTPAGVAVTLPITANTVDWVNFVVGGASDDLAVPVTGNVGGSTAGVTGVTNVVTQQTLSGGSGTSAGELSGGTGTAGLTANLVLQVGGNAGGQLFTFDKGTTAAQMATALNQASEATSVQATAIGDQLVFKSISYGSAATASVQVVNEAAGGTFGSSLTATNATGSDIQAKVNGVTATGQGNTVTLNTPSLAFSAALDPAQLSVGQHVDFNVTGGGALFQLGPQVTSAQQVNLGIQSVTTSSLGGTVGRLYEIGSGQDASLTADPTKAGQILQAALNSVTSLRGQLGAFQTATIDTNISTLTDGVTNLTAAQSSIQDADFAAESANLSREQILVQSGTTVAGIASSTPANVLSLLQKAAQV